MRSRFLRLLLLVSVVSLPLAGQADELRVSFNTDKPPFAFTDQAGNITGIEVDVMREALKRAGHSIKAMSVSKARLLASLTQDEADVAASVQGNDGDNLFYTDNFVQYQNYAISRKTSKLVIEKIDDLDKYHFVIWQRGWADLGSEFEKKYKPDSQDHFRNNYFQGSTQEAQTRIFFAKRVDVIVIDATIFQWYRSVLGKAGLAVDDDLVFHDIFTTTTGFAAAFKNKLLRDQFNTALKSMRADGSYQKILSRYH